MPLDVRVTLKTDEDEFIYTTYRGVRYGSDDIMERLNAGEDVDPEDYYFCTAPFLRLAQRGTFGLMVSFVFRRENVCPRGQNKKFIQFFNFSLKIIDS